MQASAKEASTLPKQERPFQSQAGGSQPLDTPPPAAGASAATATSAGNYTLTDEVKSKIAKRRKSMSDFSADSESDPTKMDGRAASRKGRNSKLKQFIVFKSCYILLKQGREKFCVVKLKYKYPFGQISRYRSKSDSDISSSDLEDPRRLVPYRRSSRQKRRPSQGKHTVL